MACGEEAISHIEQGAFSIALEDIKDVANMMNHLGTLADELSPVMRFLISVCVSQEYGNKVKPYLVQLAGRYPYYTKKIAEILGCTAAEVEPYVHLSILAKQSIPAKHTQILHLKCGAGMGMKPSQTMGQLIFQMALHLVIWQAL